MPDWIAKAFALLDASLNPPRSELNELDWKMSLSPDKKRLGEHLGAFANLPGGGYLVYGIEPTGQLSSLTDIAVSEILTQLANLGREAVEPPITIQHSVEEYKGTRLLFIRVPEAQVKPVHTRGKDIECAFIRSAGTTRKASRQEIGSLMVNSRSPRWEELRASILLTNDEILNKIGIKEILGTQQRAVPSSNDELIGEMVAEKFVEIDPSGGGYITNLGAIAAAIVLEQFPDVSRKSIRIVVYEGTNKSVTQQDRSGVRGYALGFQALLQHVKIRLPQTEILVGGVRRTSVIYPEIALREIIANALIHQDFSITGTGPIIEIFSDRIEVSNPGGLLPSKKLDRLIGTQPESRNELLAKTFRRYGFCEERGSGLIKATMGIEQAGLPPIKFETGSNYFRVTIYSPKPFRDMSPTERLLACYQHAVLKLRSNSSLTNKSLRERLRLPETQRPKISALIQAAIEKDLIKPSDPGNSSRKFSEYLPFWA